MDKLFKDISIGTVFIVSGDGIAMKIESRQNSHDNAVIITEPTARGSWVKAGNKTIFQPTSKVTPVSSITVEVTQKITKRVFEGEEGRLTTN